MATQNVDHAHANGHSNQNNKKRARLDEDGVHSENSQNTSSSNSNPPPTKKRKVHKKPQLNGKRRKSKKMRKSEDEHQQEYLTLLANDAKKTQNNHSNAETDEEAHIVLSQSTTSPTTTDNRSDATSPVSSSASESTLSNDASSPLQQQPEPDVTPPLPDNLSVLPFAAPFRDRDEHEQKYDSDDRSQETQTQNPQQQQPPPQQQQQQQNSNNESATSTTSTSREQNGWSVSYSPSDSISFSLQITPQARKSRPMAQQQTPNDDTEDTEAQEPQQQQKRQCPPEMEEIGDPFADTMFDDVDVDGGGELVLESVSPFESMVVRAPPAEPMHENHDDRFNMALSPLYETNAEENEHENDRGDDGGYLQNPSGTQFMAETQRTETECETVEEEVERLGPFQVIVARATSMAQSVVDIGWKLSRSLLDTVGNMNVLNVVVVFCAAVCVYVLSTVMFIPYAVAPWTETPFCDTHGSMITGTYAVFYDLIPLEQAMTCYPCPSGAQCVNGTAQCARGTQLDAHRVVCFANDDRNAAFAANMSYQASVILSERLGETDCGDGDDDLSALDETALLDAIQHRFYASLSMEELESAWQFATRNVLPTRGYSEFVYFNQTSAAYHAMHATVPSWRCWLASNTKRVPDGVLAGFAAVLLAVAGVLAYLRWRVESEYHDDVAVETTVETANFVLKWLSEHGEYHFSVNDQMKRYVMWRLQVSEITWQRAVDYIDDSQLVQSVMEDIDGEQRRCWKWTAPVAFVPLQ